MPAYYECLTVVIFVLGYVAPLLIIFACYVGVLIAMARNARTAAARQNRNTQAIKKRVTKIAIMVVSHLYYSEERKLNFSHLYLYF